MKTIFFIKGILLLTSSMTVMSGAILAPALPDIEDFFKGQNPVWIKLILTMPALMIALLAQLVGAMSDRMGRKNLLITSLAIYGLAGTAGYFINNLYVLLASRALLGIGVAGIISLSTTLIGDYFSGEERKKFTGAQASFMALGG